MKTAVVTGTSKPDGIGAAIMNLLSDNGYNVFGLDKQNGMDVTDYDKMRGAMGAAAAETGKIDLLVNNAGIGIMKPFEDFTPEDWNAVIGINLTGVYNCCHAALQYIKGGDIVNIASRSGVYAHPNLIAYCAAKAGVVMFSEALALDLRKFGIRVGYIMPGKVATNFVGEEKKEWMVQPEDVARTVLNMTLLPRRASLGRVEIKPSFPV